MTETNFAVPPGDVLAEWLDENDMTQTELAARLGRSVKHVNQVVNGVASLTSDVARELDTVTTIPAKFWLRMENTYRLDKARIEQEPISEDDAAWLALMPHTDLRKRTRISATARDKPRLLHP